MSRDRYDTHTVCHHNVPSLPRNAETSLFESVDSSKMRNSRDLAHSLCRHFDFAELSLTRKLSRHGKILRDGITDVR